MPSPATIDIDTLVQPIPGDNPAGGPLPSEPIRKKLDDFREEFDPADLDESDPRRNDPTVERKTANWQAIIDLGEETLKETSKSLLVAVRMTEALTMRSGLAGARDGFRLLRRLCEEAWDRLIPPVEEPDDLEIRAGMFNWLDDPLRSALYPNKLRAVPLLHAGSTAISFYACRGFGGKPPEVGTDQVTAAARAADPEKCQNLVDDVREAIEEVNRLGNFLNDKMPDVAPSFYEVRKAFEDCQTIAQWIRQENAGAGGGAADGEAAGPTAGGTTAGAVTTREGAYRQLEAAADALARVEPHSPVPYLVKRAVQLKDIKFPDLVEQLTKDANVLAFLKRDLTAEQG
ncbi:MAG TPA: type VI secretion system protein TssA [Gemmataceae bacterium]|jgi:type VI secretion system protein ImpA|nr:type VI secretion system protein TssA [Gemmataceae bacterium]